MKDCSPCPIYNQCLSVANEHENVLEAYRGRLRSFHQLIEHAVLTGDYDEIESMNEEQFLLAVYKHDDGRYDAESIDEAIQTADEQLPGARQQVTQYMDNEQTALMDVWSSLSAVQDNCSGPGTKSFRLGLRKVAIDTCSAEPEVLDAQSQPYINRYEADLYNAFFSLRARRAEVTALRAYCIAVLSTIPAMCSAAAAITTATIDTTIDRQIDAPTWIYETEGAVFGISLASVIVFGGLGRVFHAAAKSFDKKSDWDSLGR